MCDREKERLITTITNTGVDIETREEVGVKFEHVRSRRPQLQHEFDVMALLEGHGLQHAPFFFFLTTTCTHALTGAANSGLCARHLVRDTGRLPRTRHGPARAEPVPAHGLLRRTLLAQDRADVGRANGLQICRIKSFA